MHIDAPIEPRQKQGAWSQWGFRDLIFGSYANWFLLAAPIAALSFFLDWPDALTFSLSTVAIISVAERLSHVTNELSKSTNSVVLSGLLVVSLGNFVDLIICVFLIKDGMVEYAQLTLIGAMLSQLLFLLGMSFLVGGCRKLHTDHRNPGDVLHDALKGTQTFNSAAASSSVGTMLFGVVALMAPTLYSTVHPEQTSTLSVSLSRASAVLMMACYVALLIFQLGTHKHHYVATSTGSRILTGDETPAASRRASLDIESRPLWEAVPQEEDAAVPPVVTVDRAEAITISAGPAIVYALLFAGLACGLVEFISHSLDAITNSSQQPGVFLSVVVLPLAGNGAEIVTAIIAAWRNQILVSVNVSVGSAAQIALMVAPLLVLGSWAAQSDFALDFHLYDLLTVLFSVIIVGVLIQSGRSDYFKGILLLATYLVFAFSYYYHTVVL